jgi:Holliday junction resolvase RusA-like endonuclease
MSAITVTVPMDPPSALLPNKRHRRGGLYPGIAAAQEYRAVAKYAAMPHVNGTPIAGPVHLTIHAAYGYKRVTPDLDGTISAAKAAIDGLADAGLIYDDDQVAKITATHEKLPARKRECVAGFTVLTVEPMEAT